MTRDERIFAETALRNNEEMEKCKNDPVYFYNTYAKPKGSLDLTQEQYDAHVNYVKRIRNRRVGFDAYRAGQILSASIKFIPFEFKHP